jgi:hypothetical protein
VVSALGEKIDVEVTIVGDGGLRRSPLMVEKWRAKHPTICRFSDPCRHQLWTITLSKLKSLIGFRSHDFISASCRISGARRKPCYSYLDLTPIPEILATKPRRFVRRVAAWSGRVLIVTQHSHHHSRPDRPEKIRI